MASLAVLALPWRRVFRSRRRERTALVVCTILIVSGIAAYFWAVTARQPVGAFLVVKANIGIKDAVDLWNLALPSAFADFAFGHYPLLKPTAAPSLATGVALIVGLPLFAVLALIRPHLRDLDKGVERELQPSDVTTHGSARFATPAERADYKKPVGLLLGRDSSDKRLLHYAGNQHVTVIGPSRSGKGQGFIIPNLLAEPSMGRSFVVVDPKGENTRATAERRRNAGPVRVVDPFGLTGYLTAQFNPLANLHADDPFVVSQVGKLATALIPQVPYQSTHWVENGRLLLTAHLLHMVATEPPEQRTVARLFERLTLDPAATDALYEAMRSCEEFEGAIQRRANAFLARVGDEASGVLSTAQTALKWIDTPQLRAVTGTSDFGFGSLKKKVGTVYLVLPPEEIETYAPWLRLMLVRADSAFTTAAGDVPVSVVIDEFPKLGPTPSVRDAYGLAAGYGVQYAIVIQDFAQLRDTYREGAHTFLASSGAVLVFGAADLMTADYVSKSLGKSTVKFVSQSTSSRGGLFSASTTEAQQFIARDLQTVDELRALHPEIVIVLVQNRRPLWLRKIVAHRDREFSTLLPSSQ